MTAQRYTVQKVHATALQRRLYPESRDKPFVVRDGATSRLVGLPDRYANRSGAQARADRLNTVEAENERVDGPGGRDADGPADETARDL